MSSLRERFFEHGKLDDCPIYDLHSHMGPFFGAHLPWCDPDAAIRAMDRANVRMLVFCHHAAIFSPDIGNSSNVEAVRKHPDRFRAYCAINPNYPDIIEKDLQSYDEYPDVYFGLKFHGEFHEISITHDRNTPAWEFANDRSLPVLIHTWDGSSFDGEQQVREVAERYPNAKLLLGHSIHGAWKAAAHLAKYSPNVYLDLCAVLDDRGALEIIVEETGSEKLFFGTDFPWFEFHYYIGAILGADISDEDRRNIFYRNAQRLLGFY